MANAGITSKNSASFLTIKKFQKQNFKKKKLGLNTAKLSAPFKVPVKVFAAVLNCGHVPSEQCREIGYNVDGPLGLRKQVP